MALTVSLMFLVFFCVAVTGQDNERKNIKMLFVPAEVMKALRKNLTTKDLPPGLPGQGTQRWTPVRLPGDRTHTFEIRINPRTAHKLNMNFQHFRIGRGHGLLLELKNVSLSTKGKTVLDRLVEFYKNCGGARNHRIQHLLPMMHRRHPHSLLLPGDIPLLERIQNALERFFPKRHDGSVDVFQHKDSSGAVHFLPFEEVRREVNNLIKRTLVKRDCVKISTNALTRALSEFRRQYDNGTITPSLDEEENANDEGDNEEQHAESDGEGEEKDQVLSFSRNLDSFNPHPVNKVNLTSSSAINVPSDAAATQIVSALADLRKEINDLSSGLRKKAIQSIPSNFKETDSTSSSSISVSVVGNTGGSSGNIAKNISSDNNETNDDKNSNLANLDISEVKNKRKKMSNDDRDQQGKNISGNNNNNNNNNNSSSRSHNNDKEIAVALKLKNIEDDLKTELRKVSLKPYKNISKVTGDSSSGKNSSGNDGHTAEKVSNERLVNQTVNHLQRVKTINEVNVSKNASAHDEYSDERKQIKKQARIKGRKDRTKHRNKHKGRIKDKKIKKRPSLVFHYNPKSSRLKQRYNGGENLKADDDELVEDIHSHKGKGRFVQFIPIRRPRPKIKEMLLPDEDESDGYRQRHFDDSPVEAGNDEDNIKVRLLRKLRWLRVHGHAPKVRRRKSPKLRVVVYDDEEEDKEPMAHERWHNNDTDEYTENIHEDDSETDSEPESMSESEPESDTSHRSESLYMDDENTEQYNQGATSSSESDMQYLSDSIGDDGTHSVRSDSGSDVPDLGPYLKKHYEDEEDEENEEIKLYNDQDGIGARKLSDSMGKRISKKPKEDDAILDEKTNNIDESSNEEPGKIHIHKLPFKIQEDSDGVDTSYLKEPQHEAFGLQQVLGPGPDMTSMTSQLVPMTSNPTITTSNQNALNMSPNMVMPPEQSMMIPAAGELPQENGATTPVARPNPAAFTGVSFPPSVTTQMNSMMPQAPFLQLSSMMPMQAAAPEVSPMTPVMQPGQIRAVISRSEKFAAKRPGSKQHSRHITKVSVVGKNHWGFKNEALDEITSGH